MDEQTITILAEKLSKPATEIMNIAVAGKRLEGLLDFIIYIIFVVCVYYFAKFAKKFIKEDSNNWIKLSVIGFLGFIFFFLLFQSIEWSIISIINPQYSIIHELISK